MSQVNVQELLDSGVHFGHRTSRWNPKMKPFLRGKRNTIHIIDLKATVRGLVRATHFLRAVTGEGYDVLFVGTKRSAKNVIREEAMRAEMPFVTERWLGGTLTNFETIRGRLNRLEELEGVETSGEIAGYTKKALSRHNREKRKLLKNLSGIRNMSSLPGAVVAAPDDCRFSFPSNARPRAIDFPEAPLGVAVAEPVSAPRTVTPVSLLEGPSPHGLHRQ